MAMTEDGALWTWGCGREGRLGHGDVENRLVPTVVAGLASRRIGRCRGPPPYLRSPGLAVATQEYVGPTADYGHNFFLRAMGGCIVDSTWFVQG